jgi:hypothetical protein
MKKTKPTDNGPKLRVTFEATTDFYNEVIAPLLKTADVSNLRLVSWTVKSEDENN